jgi:hypothetical protein
MKTTFIFLLMIFSSAVSFAQWVQTSYPGGGQIRSIITIGNKLLVGNNSIGVYESDDNGETWTAINKGFISNSSVQDLYSDGTNVFAGTYRGGVFIFSENDTIWTEKNNGLTDTHVYALTSTAGHLFAGTGGKGIFVSTDNGSNWTNCGLSGKQIEHLSSDGTNILAATHGGLYHSGDNGSTWNKYDALSPGVILTAIEHNNYLYAGTSNNGIYISADNGATWAAYNNGFTPNDAWCFAFYKSDILAGGGTGVFISHDSALSWSDISDGITDKFITRVLVKDDVAFAGSAGNGALYKRLLNEFADLKKDKDPFTDEYLLQQNFPNPFKTSTTFTYRVMEPVNVVLKVSDAYGREVAILVNEVKHSGTYSFQWDASSLAAGVYYYQLQNGNNFQAKRMIIMR